MQNLGLGLRRTVAPTITPVTLAEARARLRINVGVEDADLQRILWECTELAEAECQRAFLTSTFSLTLDGFPRVWSAGFSPLAGSPATGSAPIRLPRPPAIAITSVQYYDPSGTLQTLAPSAYYLAANGEPARLCVAVGTQWPPTQWGRAEAVTVTYTAGYGTDPELVPWAARAAILLLAGDRWEHRGDEPGQAMPAAARRLLDTLEAGECR